MQKKLKHGKTIRSSKNFRIFLTTKLSFIASSRRYLDRQNIYRCNMYTRNVYTPTSTKPQRRRPWRLPSPPRWVDTLRAATLPRAGLLAPRLSCLLCLSPPTAAVSVQPLPSFLSHTHLCPVLSSLVPLPSPSVVHRFHFLLFLLRPSPPLPFRCHRRLFYPRWPRP